MKIAVDTSDLCTGRADGTTRYTRELAKRLPSLSDSEWIYFAPCGAPEKFDAKWLASPWPKYWTQSRLPWDLYREGPDTLFMPIQQIPFVRPKRMKTVAVVHDLAFHIYPEQFTYKDWMLQHIFTAYVAREVDQLIVVSQSTADDVEKYYGRSEGVQVVHHGVDHEKFKPDANSQSLVEGPYILYVGQIQPRKNLERLVEAFEKIREDDGDLKLVIAGGHGWLQKPILKRIEESKARDHIKMLGHVPDEDLPRLYQQAEAFMLPSLYEGFGMPILEAMACGCPVVTSNVSSMPEVAGDAAILVDPKSVESMVSGIRDARSRRTELHKAGIERAAHFTWDKTADVTAKILLKQA